MQAPADGNRPYLGTTGRTWIEWDKRRVGRIFARGQMETVEHLHRLIADLVAAGVPVQRPLTEPEVRDGRVIVYYTFCEHDPEDCDGSYYVPKATPARMRNAAAVFAAFQRAAARLEGPERPLDDPYCNTLAWLAAEDPVGTLCGAPMELLTSLGLRIEVDELAELVAAFAAAARPLLAAAPWGLCHGDYHAGNVIFAGERVGHVVDLGFWLHHPLPFDLAVTLEHWGQDLAADPFALDPRRIGAFLDAYVRSGGPVDPAGDFVYLLPLARLWLELYPVRKDVAANRWDRARTRLAERVLPRLRWYERHAVRLL